MTSASFRRETLVGAWLAHRRWAAAHPDLREFHVQRYRALSNAFGVDLDAVPPAADFGLAGLFAATVNVIETTRTPFSGSLELDAQIHELHRAHGHVMAESATELIAECRTLLEELVGMLWGLDERRVVPGSVVAAHGWDPRTPEPDPDDFW